MSFDALAAHRKVAMVTDGRCGPREIAAQLMARGKGHRWMVIGENLAMENERIHWLPVSAVEDEYAFHPEDTAALHNDSDNREHTDNRFHVPVLRNRRNENPADVPEPAWNAGFLLHPSPQIPHCMRNWILEPLPHKVLPETK